MIERSASVNGDRASTVRPSSPSTMDGGASPRCTSASATPDGEVPNDGPLGVEPIDGLEPIEGLDAIDGRDGSTERAPDTPEVELLRGLDGSRGGMSDSAPPSSVLPSPFRQP